jgi:glycerol-1-phosphate dehydrogenase [NAD(P)+]
MYEQQIRCASPAELAGVDFLCACGRRHAVDIATIRVGSGTAEALLAHLKTHHASLLQGTRPDRQPVVLVSDTQTAIAQADDLSNSLPVEGLTLLRYTFRTEAGHPLVPEEAAIGALLTALPRDTAMIVAVGSGTINDICRFVADRMHIPYVIVCTAPSVDGYASTVSPLILNGHKTTLEACYPEAVLADPDVLRNAPAELLQAGFGDLLGKLTALADWELARRLQQEYHCPLMEAVVRKALAVSTAQAAGIAARDADACRDLFEALLLSGLAMGMVGNSRPASGAEHHLSHYWEMDALKNGKPHALHGNAVGAATPVVARLYELMSDWLPEGFAKPDASHIRSLLVQAGAADSPRALGVSRALFHQSLLEAMHVRPRFTILRLAADLGQLERLADQITTEFYDAST